MWTLAFLNFWMLWKLSTNFIRVCLEEEILSLKVFTQLLVCVIWQYSRNWLRTFKYDVFYCKWALVLQCWTKGRSSFAIEDIIFESPQPISWILSNNANKKLGDNISSSKATLIKFVLNLRYKKEYFWMIFYQNSPSVET